MRRFGTVGGGISLRLLDLGKLGDTAIKVRLKTGVVGVEDMADITFAA